MVDAEAVRRVGLALPRTYEAFIGRRWKLKVRQLVYVAFSRDETSMGFGFPRDARDSLIASDPETFFLPPTSDLRYQWVCAHLARLDEAEMRELVTDAWRMCVPQMLHDLPDQPEPVAAAWWAMDAAAGTTCGRCCIPTCTGRTAAASSVAAPRCSTTCATRRRRDRLRRGDPRRAGLPLAELDLMRGPRR